jgi:lysophospholipase
MLRALMIFGTVFAAAGGEASRAWAVSESNFDLQYATQVLPWYASHGKTGELVAFDGVKLSYRSFERADERGALVVLPGRTEPYAKYAEVVYDLREAGYSVYLLDHRGQGASGRMTADREMGYVRKFADYVRDLELFMEKVVRARPHRKTYLLAHSMGAAISTLYAMAHPGHFDAAVFSSPMFQLQTGKYSEPMALAMSSAAVAAGQGKHYAPGKGPYDPKEVFGDNNATHSEKRWGVSHDLMVLNPLFRMGGASMGWVKESILADYRIRARAADFHVPVLIYQAGQDQTVKLSGQAEFCAKAEKCSLHLFPEALHEVLQEKDAVRDVALTEALKFFDTH